MCSSGDILWNLVSALRLFSLISPLKSLVPVKSKSLVLGYLAIDPVPLLNSLFQNKGAGVAMIRLAAGLPGAAVLCPLVIALLVRMLDKASISRPCSVMFWFLPFSGYICLSFSLPLSALLSTSLLPNTFSSQQNMKTHLSPLDNSTDNKKIHFSVMECQAEWMYSKINCSTN